MHASCLKRLIAFSIDNFVLTVLGLLFFPLSKFFAGVPALSLILLFLVACFYFAILESKYSASLGKRLLKLKVIDEAGGKPKLFEGWVRAGTLYFPLIGGVVGSLLSGFSSVEIIYGFFGILLDLGSTLFLILHPQKRGLHEIISHTATVSATTDEVPAVMTAVPKRALVITLAVALVLGFGSKLYYNQMMGPSEIKELTESAEKVRQQFSLEEVHISINQFKSIYKNVKALELEIVSSASVMENVESRKQLVEGLFKFINDQKFSFSLDEIHVTVKVQGLMGIVSTSTEYKESKPYVGPQTGT